MKYGKKQIRIIVLPIISRVAGIAVEHIIGESQYIRDLRIDSLDSVELVMDIEDAFDITISDSESELIYTKDVDYLITYLEGVLSDG